MSDHNRGGLYLWTWVDKAPALGSPTLPPHFGHWRQIEIDGSRGLLRALLLFAFCRRVRLDLRLLLGATTFLAVGSVAGEVRSTGTFHFGTSAGEEVASW